YFVRNDILLDERLRMQIHWAIVRLETEAQAREVTASNELSASERNERLQLLRNLYYFTSMSSFIKGCEKVLRHLHSSTTIAATLKSPDFRAWYHKNCTAEMMVTLGADRPVLSHDATPWNSFIQSITDVVF